MAMHRMRWMLRNSLGRDVTVAMVIKLLLLGALLVMAGRATRPLNDAATAATGILGDPSAGEVH
jgi:hypothetical protein